MKNVVFFLCTLLFMSCEKNINFKLAVVPNVMVIDASIENNQAPIVVLSRSFNYFSSINNETVDTSFVHQATVMVSDGNQTQQLIEYTTTAYGYPIYFYSQDTASNGNAFKGKLNTSYSLKVITGGSEYDAVTTIPGYDKQIDSLWWKQAPYTTDTTEVVVLVRTTDPPGLGNYVRYFTRVNSGTFLPGVQSVFDDEFIDGTTYDLQLSPGVNRNNPIAFDKNFFHRGDTVTLKLSGIDRTTYEFWLTMEFAYQSIGNPFASPNKVLGNISNGGLGSFCGYASQYSTIIVPK